MEKTGSSPPLGLSIILNELDWSEPWLFGVLASYILLGLLILKTRFENGIQLFVFVILLMVVYVSEDINEYLARNHKLFTRYQYFDSSGTFISLFMSLPLLFFCTLILSNWLVHSSRLLSKMRRPIQRPKED
uniref:Transmembrane protein 18 n=1 Tax=Caligus rogercresseyi TaxID=217165 RepID=C1BQC0_CALRO|nr:Transmembrane protein 18 [Caligus rogercresseyi]